MAVFLNPNALDRDGLGALRGRGALPTAGMAAGGPVLMPAHRLGKDDHGEPMTEFSLPYVSVASSGDEDFHVSFEERKDGSVDDGPYLLDATAVRVTRRGPRLRGEPPA